MITLWYCSSCYDLVVYYLLTKRKIKFRFTVVEVDSRGNSVLATTTTTTKVAFVYSLMVWVFETSTAEIRRSSSLHQHYQTHRNNLVPKTPSQVSVQQRTDIHPQRPDEPERSNQDRAFARTTQLCPHQIWTILRDHFLPNP